MVQNKKKSICLNKYLKNNIIMQNSTIKTLYFGDMLPQHYGMLKLSIKSMKILKKIRRLLFSFWVAT